MKHWIPGYNLGHRTNPVPIPELGMLNSFLLKCEPQLLQFELNLNFIYILDSPWQHMILALYSWHPAIHSAKLPRLGLLVSPASQLLKLHVFANFAPSPTVISHSMNKCHHYPWHQHACTGVWRMEKVGNHWVHWQVSAVASKEQTNYVFITGTDYVTIALHLPGLLRTNWKWISKVTPQN